MFRRIPNEPKNRKGFFGLFKRRTRLPNLLKMYEGLRETEDPVDELRRRNEHEYFLGAVIDPKTRQLMKELGHSPMAGKLFEVPTRTTAYEREELLRKIIEIRDGIGRAHNHLSREAYPGGDAQVHLYSAEAALVRGAWERVREDLRLNVKKQIGILRESEKSLKT